MTLHPAPDQADELQLAKDYLHDALSYTQQRRRDLAITAIADAAHRLSNDPEIRTLADQIVRANEYRQGGFVGDEWLTENLRGAGG